LQKKDDGSVWIDLTDEGLDEKLLLRADGTSVYITQDLGTAQLRHNDFDAAKMIYVVGNEQIYHFDVLKKILAKMDKSWASGIFHLSYGMVELPEGKMKSREGTVVDADELMEEMVNTAKQKTEELGKIDGFDEETAKNLYEMIGMSALKYFILKVDPKKTMLFNPQESIDFNGHTGPFIQYTYARIRSILRKGGYVDFSACKHPMELLPKEKELLRWIYEFPQAVNEASDTYSPAVVANYVYDLARVFNQFYHEINILRETDEICREFRIGLSALCGRIICDAMDLLGIEVPEKM
jgi:arginyl-tRNA synthetase